MFSKLIYYIFVFPLSLMPLPVLYGFTRFFMFIVYRIFGYRKEVVLMNLRNSYPAKTETEIQQIADDFYTHFGELAAEGIKGFTIGEKELMARYHFTNPELVEEMYKAGRSVILVSGHYNNWEFLVQSLDLQFSHQGVGVGKPISNQGFGKIMDDARMRFGNLIWDHTNVRQNFEGFIKNKKLFACMLLSDQSPSNHTKAFWMRFLNQDTPVLYGPEYFAKKYDVPVFFYIVNKIKRGYYELTLTPVTYHPKDEPYGDIIYKTNKLLEANMTNPAEWLWTHKKWKYANNSKDFEVRI